MSLADPYLVTPYVHPSAKPLDAHFDSALHPDGYVDYISRLGRGAFCDGLFVHTPESRKARWNESMIEELLVNGLEDGNWEKGILTGTDLKNCMVIADSIEGDCFLTCPRFGKHIFELPRQQTAIRQIGTSLSDY
ncbi:MAG: hypothetical protein U0930_02320 [Pirellulales bacterium]